MRKLLFIVLFVSASTQLLAQGTKIVWPYEMIAGKMLVEVELNGTKMKAMFDTGAAKNTISDHVLNQFGLKVTSSQLVTDANNNKQEYKKTRIDTIAIPGTKLVFTKFEALIVKKSPYDCYGTDLLIGSEMFANLVVEIDDKAKTITLTGAGQQPQIALRNSTEFLGENYMPVVGVTMDGMTMLSLFDTGYGGFFKFKKDDYLKNKSSFNTIAEAISEGSVGISGKAAAATSHRVLLKRMNFTVGKFLDVVVETGAAPMSLIGTKMLQYGKVTIDYPRRRLYFEPYEKEVIMPQPLNDFAFTIKEGKMVLSTVWSTTKDGITNGDVVTHINGKKVPEFDFCDCILNGVPQLREKKESTLTINGKKKIKYINRK